MASKKKLPLAFAFFILFPFVSSGQEILFSIPGIRGTVYGIPGRDTCIPAATISVPFNTIHQADRSTQLPLSVYDRTANLFSISRLVDESSIAILPLASSTSNIEQMFIEGYMRTNGPKKVLFRYDFSKVVLQSTTITCDINNVPMEKLTFSYASGTITYYDYGESGQLISTRRSLLINEADSRRN